jgi:formate dehydrogenase subunit gamma
MTGTTIGEPGVGGVAPPSRIVRFDRTERWVHWVNAALFLVLLFTGAALYAGPVSQWVGRRELVKRVHVYAGVVLPLPVLVGVLLRSGAALRADLRRFNRWDAHDRAWWKPRGRRQAQLEKFNPGQKLNAVFVGASIVVMLASGSIMRWFEPFPVDWRTGATFVHDVLFIALAVAIVGHIALALADPAALRGMVRGSVPTAWARAKRPRWCEAHLPTER